MVYMLFGTGFEETEAMAPLDCLRRAGVEVMTLGIGGREICSSHGVVMQADACLEDMEEKAASDMEMLILPGGLGGVNAMKASAAAERLIRASAAEGKWLAAICAGPTVPGGMGLLKGKKATCYPGMEGGMVGAVPQYAVGVAQDGRIITGEAAGSCIPFGLRLVEVLKGRAVAEKVAASIYYRGNF